MSDKLQPGALKKVKENNLKAFVSASRSSSVVKQVMRARINETLEKKKRDYITNGEFEKMLNNVLDLSAKLEVYEVKDFWDRLDVQVKRLAKDDNSDFQREYTFFLLKNERVPEEEYVSTFNKAVNWLDLYKYYEFILDGWISVKYQEIYLDQLPKILAKYGKEEGHKFWALLEKGYITEETYNEVVEWLLWEYQKNRYKRKYDGADFTNIVIAIKDYGIKPEEHKEDIELAFDKICETWYVSAGDVEKIITIFEFDVIELKLPKKGDENEELILHRREKLEIFFWNYFSRLNDISDYKLGEWSYDDDFEAILKFVDECKRRKIFTLRWWKVPIAMMRKKYEMTNGVVKSNEVRNWLYDLHTQIWYSVKAAYTRVDNTERLENTKKHWQESDGVLLHSFLEKRCMSVVEHDKDGHIGSAFYSEIIVIVKNFKRLNTELFKELFLKILDHFNYPNTYGSNVKEFVVEVCATWVIKKWENATIDIEVLKRCIANPNAKQVDELIAINYFDETEREIVREAAMDGMRKNLTNLETKEEVDYNFKDNKLLKKDSFLEYSKREWLRWFKKHEEEEIEPLSNKMRLLYQKHLEYWPEMAKRCVLDKSFAKRIVLVTEQLEKRPFEYLEKLKRQDLLKWSVDFLYSCLVKEDDQSIRRFYADHFYQGNDGTCVKKLIADFGERAVFKFLGDGKRDPHNAVQSYDKIMKFYRKEYGVRKKDEFVATFMVESGWSEVGYDELNAFLAQYKTTRRKKLKEAVAQDIIPNERFTKNCNLLLQRDEEKTLHKTRANFFLLGDVLYILAKKPALEAIENLRHGDEREQKIYKYFSEWILSARKKDIKAMMLMRENPKKFLGLPDKDAPALLHNALKPSNWAHFPHLDLSEREIVESIILGYIDELSYFQPMKMTFLTGKGHAHWVEGESSKEDLYIEFFQTMPNVTLAWMVKKYNGRLNQFRNDQEWWEQMSYKQVRKDVTQLPEQQLKRLLEEAWIEKKSAEVHPKSFVWGWYNWFNCDALGMRHGKKVVMMFNPFTTDLCVYQGDYQEEVDNLRVTSRMTLNEIIGWPSFRRLSRLIKKGRDPRNYLPDNHLEQTESLELMIDNIEAWANYARKCRMYNDKRKEIEQIYSLFLSAYVQKYPVSQWGVPIENTKATYGKGHSKIKFNSKEKDNDTFPIMPCSYSDNASVLWGELELQWGEEVIPPRKTGIREMDIEDMLKVIHLEHKIYPEWVSENPLLIQQEICASMIKNKAQNRKNLHKSVYDKDGKMIWYSICYEGVVNKEENEACVYIKDLAVVPEEKGVWLELMRTQIKEIREQYPDRPIVAELRENSSYRIVNAYIHKFGLRVREKKKGKYVWGERYFKVVLEPGE